MDTRKGLIICCKEKDTYTLGDSLSIGTHLAPMSLDGSDGIVYRCQYECPMFAIELPITFATLEDVDAWFENKRQLGFTFGEKQYAGRPAPAIAR
ncbi:MAG: hypothetical protein LBT46_00245 [Planctomycetaceae bacterium]|nr:hypothetical protein [Planctomycetaceae bacterium]